jgi:hypothetical protein
VREAFVPGFEVGGIAVWVGGLEAAEVGVEGCEAWSGVG